MEPNNNSLTLFKPEKFNHRKHQLEQRIDSRNEFLGFALFMTGKFFTVSAGLACFFALLITAPAVISLMILKMYQPEPITIDSIALPTDPGTDERIRHLDYALLWTALGLSVAAALCLLLRCILSGCNDQIRDEKTNVKELLARIKKIPDLKADATVEFIEAAVALLADIQVAMSPYLFLDVENESEPLLKSSMSL